MTPNSASKLTRRELQVLLLLADGFEAEQIAERLFISPKTVATHIQRVLTKLGVHSRAQAVALAHRHHLVDAADRAGR
jgi:DNA-binding NarL/FixJ family response regulator